TTAGQVITIKNVTLPSSWTLTITYGTVGHRITTGTGTGAQTLTAKEASLSGGTLTALTAGSPTVTVGDPAVRAVRVPPERLASFAVSVWAPVPVPVVILWPTVP